MGGSPEADPGTRSPEWGFIEEMLPGETNRGSQTRKPGKEAQPGKNFSLTPWGTWRVNLASDLSQPEVIDLGFPSIHWLRVGELIGGQLPGTLIPCTGAQGLQGPENRQPAQEELQV